MIRINWNIPANHKITYKGRGTDTPHCAFNKRAQLISDKRVKKKTAIYIGLREYFIHKIEDNLVLFNQMYSQKYAQYSKFDLVSQF